MLRPSPLALARLSFLLAALPLLGVSPGPAHDAQVALLAAPGECARARDLEVRTEPLGGTARGRTATDVESSVSGAAFRHFRAADVSAPLGVATSDAADWAALSAPKPRAFTGPGPCDTPGSGCRGISGLAPAVRSAPSAPTRARRAPQGRGKGRGGGKCD